MLLLLDNITRIHSQKGGEESTSSLEEEIQIFYEVERMEGEVPYRLIITIVFIAVLIGGVVSIFYSTPLYPRLPLDRDESEGFVPRNLSEGLRTLPEAETLLSFLDKAGAGAGKAQSAVRAELELLLHKMAALVADLTSTDRMVRQTRHLPFETAHDRMVVGELCGMCLQQTMSARDLDILLDTWRERGSLLLRKLCTVENLSETDALFSEKLWKDAWMRVHEVATTQCVKSLPSLAIGARDATPFEPLGLKDAHPYTYLYGGLSASGGNGVV
jgi:hypothetical protein